MIVQTVIRNTEMYTGTVVITQGVILPVKHVQLLVGKDILLFNQVVPQHPSLVATLIMHAEVIVQEVVYLVT